MNIPVNSPLAFIGFICLAVGGFMVLAGLDIIKIQQVTVKQGRRTWVTGVVFAVVGIALLYPELITPSTAPNETVAPSSAPVSAPAQASTSTSKPTGEVSDWTPISFDTPSGTRWSRTAAGDYTAVGTDDAFAWSTEQFAGDLELVFDVSSKTQSAGAHVVVYGDGAGFSPGVLVFGVDKGYQKIMSGTVYAGGIFLDGVSAGLDLQGTHTLGIRIVDRVAKLSVDGQVIASAVLDDNVNTAGKVGLYKWGGAPSVTFSNARVRVPASGG
jgi:hypothetical protein